MRFRTAPGRWTALGFWTALAFVSLGCGQPGEGVIHEVQVGDATLRFFQVSSQRVGRSRFEYGFAATLTRAEPGGATTMWRVASETPATRVLDGILSFPMAPSGTPAASLDTFRVEHDRGLPFQPELLRFEPGQSAPDLTQSDPTDLASAIPVTAWIRLDFSDDVEAELLSAFELACDGAPLASAVHALTSRRLVVNPASSLPGSALCRLEWPGPSGPAALRFETAPSAPAATVHYDRADASALPPLPDDFWRVADAGTRTGYRLEVPIPPRTPAIEQLMAALVHDANQLDGWSPIAPIVVELSSSADPTSLPATPAESLDPLATVALFDLTPGAASYGTRFPIRVEPRDDTTAGGASSFSLLVFPSVPLRPKGRYVFVVTRRALAESGAPFDASAFFAVALAEPSGPAPEPVERVRTLLAPTLEALSSDTAPPLLPDDLALVLQISIRSTDDIPRDLIEIKRQILAAPPPRLLSYQSEPEDSSWTAAGSQVMTIVRGEWDAPDWRRLPDGRLLPEPNVTRDAEGLPVQQRSRPVPFLLAIPEAAREGPVPLIMHQHGNPGDLEEVLGNARRFLSQAGFAVIGFTDILNREVSPEGDDSARIFTQVANILVNLVQQQRVPDHWLETTAEQLAFLRMLESFGGDGDFPEIDAGAPLSYHGVSEGANNGTGLIAYTPELEAAALVVGGARLTETLIHQQSALLLSQLAPIFPGISPAELWAGMALFQTVYDVQDRHNHLEFVYRDPIEIDGTTRKPSVLLIEGLEDSLVPNHATDSAAWTLGPVPHLAPVQRPVAFLDVVHDSVQANIDADTTAAYFQYVPVGIPGIPPTPGCMQLSPTSASEGHFCAQSAVESRLQRVLFFQSALEEGAPAIVDPFPFFE